MPETQLDFGGSLATATTRTHAEAFAFAFEDDAEPSDDASGPDDASEATLDDDPFFDDDVFDDDGFFDDVDLPEPELPSAFGGYDVEVVFTNEFDGRLLGAFQAAVDTLGRIITEDLPAVFTDAGEFVDDLRIEATVQQIDGVGEILAGATPTQFREDGSPFAGVTQFDEADALQLLEGGTWDDVVLHEFLHVVGLGPLWRDAGLLETIDGSLRFVGENAIAAYAEVFPEIAAADPLSDRGVPVETEGGPGTAERHWDEVIFGDELMTGFLSPDGNTLTDLSIASLEDLGYETVWEAPLVG